jgi:hypothetical protein
MPATASGATGDITATLLTPDITPPPQSPAAYVIIGTRAILLSRVTSPVLQVDNLAERLSAPRLCQRARLLRAMTW